MGRVVMQRMRQFKADMFKALAHPTRLAILEHLRDGELTVSGLQARLEIEATAVSQQLAVLRAQRLVAGRKEGTSVYYRAVDPQIFAILALAREIFANHISELQAVAEEEPPPSSSPPGEVYQGDGMATGDADSRGA
jgi:DNA-binding transcriptional ArsR family regulator